MTAQPIPFPAPLTHDELVTGPLADLLRSAEVLRKAASRAARADRHSPDALNLLRISKAAEELLYGWQGRVLLEARTSAQRERDNACSEATTAELKRLHDGGLNVSAGR
jgi:hypothetical protein